jgi:magnesium-transporting ATPase (P-type)
MQLSTESNPLNERREVMNASQKTEEENSFLRWGGLAGVLGGIFFILVFAVVIVFVGPDYLLAKPEEMIRRFPDIRAARTVENGLYLVVLVLWVAHFLALYRALRERSHAPALFGSVLGIVGLGVLAAGALPHVATAPISDLYHAAGATLEDQTTLAFIWQATQGIFDALLFVGLVLLPIGLIALGVAMQGTPAFGKGFGKLTVGLGVIGVIAAAVVLIDPLSPVAPLGVFALIIFNLVVGWKVYRLSKAGGLPR